MPETIYVRHGRLHYFIREIFKRFRVPAADASKVADAMVAADLAGWSADGIARLPFFIERLSANLINPKPRIRPVHQAPATVTLDGDNGMGHVVATVAMELVLRKADRGGIAAASVRRSNDFGHPGYYARLALDRQMIGIAMSNAAPMVVPPNGKRALYGVNPLAIAVPTVEGTGPFVWDMSTTAATKADIESALRAGQTIPEGWALDEDGGPTTDPKRALKALRLLPLGSQTGFGLGLAVDILSGVLSGGSFGLELAGAEGGKPGVAKLAHFFIAIRIRSFGPWVPFRNRIAELVRKLRGPSSTAPERIYYPGEIEYETEQRRRAEGIPIPPEAAQELRRIARGLDLQDAWEHLLETRK